MFGSPFVSNPTEGFTVDCMVVCGNAVFFFIGIVSVG